MAGPGSAGLGMIDALRIDATDGRLRVITWPYTGSLAVWIGDGHADDTVTINLTAAQASTLGVQLLAGVKELTHAGDPA